MTGPNSLPDEVELLALAELQKRVKGRQAATKAVVGAAYAPGDRHTFRSPVDGARIGQVWRTDPDAEWVVTDRDALHAHLRQFPGCTETVFELADDTEAIVDVLHAAAPHLLVEVTRVREDVVESALIQSREDGKPAAPGIELRKPEGVLTVRPDPAAGAVIERLQQTGWLGWDGRPQLPPASEEAS
jgi:hypothetical protein